MQVMPGARTAKIAVLTLYTAEIAEWAKPAAEKKREYCAQHGYDFVCAAQSLDETRSPVWSKLLLIQRYMQAHPECEWVFWTDADSVIMNPAIRLERFIDDCELIIAEDANGINLGEFLLRNCQCSLALLNRAFGMTEYIGARFCEQSAVAELLRSGELGLRVKKVPQTWFNAYPEAYRPGDFLIHFAGIGNKAEHVVQAIQAGPPSKHFPTISGVILTRNEEANILDCIRALRPHVSEILLIDMESSDRTVELAGPQVDKVLRHPLVPNFDAARNIAIPEASNDWLWFVDADERIPERTGRLVNELIWKEGDKLTAIVIPFKTYFCGQWIQHGSWWPGYTGPRVLKRGHFEFNATLHGGVKQDGCQLLLPPDPQLAVEHFSYRTIEHYISKVNQYTSTESLQLAQTGVSWNWQEALRVMMRDLWWYYEANGGWQDGERGWILSWLSGQYRWLSRAKLIDLAEGHPLCTRPSSAPESLDAAVAVMEQELSALRATRPKVPLGIVWRSPIWGFHGYAVDSRTIVKALAGGTRPLRVEEAGEARKTCVLAETDAAILKALGSTKRPPYSATIWNCLAPLTSRDPLAAVNIVRTAYETDRLPEGWVSHLEQFDEVWVMSRHSERAFRRSGVAPEKMRVVPSGIDTSIYLPTGDRIPLPDQLLGRFVFLSVFDWHLRKGWDVLLRAYCREFRPDEGVGLLLKITRWHGHPLQTVLRQVAHLLGQESQAIGDRPDIVVWEKDLSEAEMAALYRSAHAFVLPTRGEGWGRPFMEAMACGLPTIGPATTGNAEFMNEKNSFIVPAEEVPVPPTALLELPHWRSHRWSEPDLRGLQACMRRVRKDESTRQAIAEQAAAEVRRRFDLRSTREQVEQALSMIERRFVSVVVPEAAPQQIRVELEGEFFAGHSFSMINEQLSLRLLEDHSIALAARRVQHGPVHDLEVPHAYMLRPVLERQFENGPEVTIRHAFPPNWQRPSLGRWVHIQPWEFGWLPIDWAAPLRDEVDEIWAPSEYVRRVYERSGIPPQKIHVIPWGVDPAVFNPQAPPRFLSTAKSFAFLFVGGTIHRKGIDRVLEAYLAEFTRDDDVCLVVKDMGTQSFYRYDNYREQILQAAANGRNPEILYSDKDLTPGQLASLYTACHCLVAPYRGEGFGLPILEAMACGVPTIVPRGGASDDFVTEDGAFIVPSVEVQDAHPWQLCGPPRSLSVRIEDLRGAMRCAYEQRQQTQEMGRRASRAVSYLTWAETARKMSSRLQVLAGRDRERSTLPIPSSPAVVQGTRESLDQRRLAISACMIVRDSAATLDAALSSIKPWVDELVVVDTGSLDDTAEIATKHGARLFHFPWCDDFSAARNESIRHAKGKWIFWMDSDDTISAACGRQLRELADQPLESSPMAYVMQVYCPGADQDDSPDLTVVDHVKLFRNLPEVRFDGRIHEQILPAIRRAGGEIRWTDIFVVHTGADLSVEGRQRKQARDLRLLQLELAERPDHPFTLFNLGMTYVDTREFDKAIDAISRSILVSPVGDSHVRKAYALLVNSLTELGRTASAWEICQKGLLLFPKDPELLFREGILAHRCGRLEEAERAYLGTLESKDERHFASIDPGITGFKARHNLAVVYTEMGRLADAETQWRRVLEEVPNFAAGWRGLCDVLIRQGKRNVAAAEADRLLNDWRLRAEGLLIHAEVCKVEGRIEEARAFLEQAGRQSPQQVDPLRQLCQLLFECGDPLEAEKTLARLVEREPTDASAQHNLGTVRLRLGRFAEAVEAYRASLRLRPNSAPSHFNLGHALRSLGRLDEAKAEFAEAGRLAPDSEEILKTLAEFRTAANA